MIMKIIGCLCIIASTTYIGFYYSNCLYKRVKYLVNLKTSLSLLESEIGFSANRLEDAFRHIGKISETKNLYFDVADKIDSLGIKKSWLKGIKSVKHQMCLTDEDIEILSAFGGELGMTNRENQIKNIRYITSLLEKQYIKAKDEYDRSSKICRSFGILSGLFLVIILL